MNIVLLIARLLLAVVFVVAGISKLADREGSRQAMTNFGIPAALAASFGLLLPLVELAVAAALLPGATAWWGAVGALALLLLFVVGISANLARGRKSECHCFGQLHSASAGPKTLARNGVLVAVAAVVVWQGRDGAGPSALGWIAELTAGELVALVLGLVALALLAGQWWFLLNLLRYNGRLLVRVEALEAKLSRGGTVPAGNGAQQAAGLPVGSEAPEVKLPDLQGNTVELEDFRGEETLVLFWNPGCGFCQQMLPDLKEWDEDRPEDAPKLLVVSAGSEEANRKMGLSSMVVLAQHFAVGQAFGASGTPSGVLVDAEGKVASDLAVGAPAVLELVGASQPDLRVP